MNNPYDSLDIPKDATDDDIKKAYREMSKSAHPDKGGDKESFMAVQVAYDILSDQRKRREFDNTGTVKEKNINKEAVQMMVQQFSKVLVESIGNTLKPFSRIDIIAKTKRHIKRLKGDTNVQVGNARDHGETLKDALERLSYNGDDADALTYVITEAILDIEIKVQEGVHSIEVCKAALLMVDHYTFETETGDAEYDTGMMPEVKYNSLLRQITGEAY